MKKNALLIFLLLIPCSTFANETVRFAIGEWAPYTSVNDARGRLLENIVTEAFKREGFSVEYEYFPWKRSYSLVESGQFDGTFPWAITEEHIKKFWVMTRTTDSKSARIKSWQRLISTQIVQKFQRLNSGNS